ncbi:hypothetical protein CDAR_396441 [Caerostris darwini]|uniref:Uncharacterized protein n=1 Tax=Caerostris darwini TaxID=1538125 RepID=A0AAV4SYI2_9ARAC|nr:hypothetical protein CDAR_396441 [Caerostris darwini]
MRQNMVRLAPGQYVNNEPSSHTFPSPIPNSFHGSFIPGNWESSGEHQMNMVYKLPPSPEAFTRRHMRSNGEVQSLALHLPAGIRSLSTRLLVECVHDDYCTFHFVSRKTILINDGIPSFPYTEYLQFQYVSKVE